MEEFEAKESSNIHWARYRNGVLEIDFRDAKTGLKRSTYQYDGTLIKDGSNPTGRFPVDEWQGLCGAARKGRYFAEKIRNVYKPVKIS